MAKKRTLLTAPWTDNVMVSLMEKYDVIFPPKAEHFSQSEI